MKKVTIYTVKTAESIEFGFDTIAALEDITDEYRMIWATPHTYAIPDDYEIAENIYSQKMIFTANGHGNALITGRDDTVILVNAETTMHLHPLEGKAE